MHDRLEALAQTCLSAIYLGLESMDWLYVAMQKVQCFYLNDALMSDKEEAVILLHVKLFDI